MRHLITIAALSAALLPYGACAAETPPLHVGSIYASKSGSGSTPLILIPGLGCGPWVWKDFIASLPAKTFTVFEITPAGFDRTPPPAEQTDIFEGYATSIVQLIREQHIAAPVLIGHSMGGELSLRIGELEPSIPRGIVLVDSLPIFPPLSPGETVESRRPQWQAIIAKMKAQTDAEHATAEARGIAGMVTDPKTAADVTLRVLQSDRATVTQISYELVMTDLGPDLKKLIAPTLVLGETAAGYPPDATEKFYRDLYAGAPNVTVHIVANSRHFIMLDQPAAFRKAVLDFIATLK